MNNIYSSVLEYITKAIESIYSWVWSPALVGLCLVAGLYFTLRTRFVQVRRFREMFRLLFGSAGKNKKAVGISSFQAFAMALSGRVGTGNIVGVATAIGFGGPGAIVWMWVIVFFGAGSAFVEATLAQMYKENHNGQHTTDNREPPRQERAYYPHFQADGVAVAEDRQKRSAVR